MSDFLLAYPNRLPTDVFGRILTPILNGAKSSNATVRSQSGRLFAVLVDREGTEDVAMSLAVVELAALPKAGKTTGADHRIALYGMLRSVKPTLTVASTIISTLPSLLTKETNDFASSLLAQTLAPHIAFRLRENQAVDPDVTSVIVRDMSGPKPALRRAFCTIAGNALWHLGNDPTDAARQFATAVFPAFETNLKTISANPLNSVAGPLEGYVALAVLLGPGFRLQIPKYGEVALSLYLCSLQRRLDGTCDRDMSRR